MNVCVATRSFRHGRFSAWRKTFFNKNTTVLLVLCIFWAFTPLRADEVFLTDSSVDDDLYFGSIPSVFSASKFEQKVTQAPATVSVITAEEIARYGYQTIGEILASLPGIYTTNDRNYGYLGVRGFSRPGDYNTRVLFLIDGQRYDDVLYLSTGLQNDFPIDVDLIERVEFIRGPGSALYGSSAMLGFVNIITKRGRDISGLELSAEVGSFDTYKFRGTYGTRLENGLEVLLSATKYDSDGQKKLYYPEFDDPDTNNGFYENNDNDSHESFKAMLGYKDFTFNAAWSSREKRIPTASYGTVFNDNRAHTVDEYMILNLAYSSLWADRFDVSGNMGYVRYHYDADYPYDWPPVFINHDVANGQAVDAEIHFSFDLNERHHLLFGFEGRYAFRQDQLNFDILDDEDAIYLDDRRDSTNWGVFVQDDVSVTSKLTAVLGIRYDHYDNFDGNTSPRLALVYKLSPASIFKVLYGEAFRVPNAYELYYEDDFTTQKPPENLQPEESSYYELVLEHSFRSSLRGTLSLYKYYISDVIELVTDPVDELLQFRNGSKVDISGIEVGIEGQGPWGTHGRISYSHSDGHDEITGAKPVNSPRHMAKLNVGFPILDDRLSAGFELQYISGRRLLKDGWSKSSLVANLGLQTGTLMYGLRLGFHAYNLFDEVIEHPAGEEHDQRVIQQDGRSFRLKLTATF